MSLWISIFIYDAPYMLLGHVVLLLKRADHFVSHGSAPCVEKEVGEPNLNTGQILPVTAQTPPIAAENYRESGLVVCPACSIAWG